MEATSTMSVVLRLGSISDSSVVPALVGEHAEVEFSLRGDRVLFCTDGLVEHRTEGADVFGEVRMRAIIERAEARGFPYRSRYALSPAS
jgi:hypothetical protein